MVPAIGQEEAAGRIFLLAAFRWVYGSKFTRPDDVLAPRHTAAIDRLTRLVNVNVCSNNENINTQSNKIAKKMKEKQKNTKQKW